MVYINEYNRKLYSIFNMSYIDALYKKDEDKVYVVERNSQVKRAVF